MSKITPMAVAIPFLFSACASTEVRQQAEKTQTQAEQKVSKIYANNNNRPIILKQLNYPYLGAKSVAEPEYLEELPRSLRAATKFKFGAKPITLEEFAKVIVEETNVPVKTFADSTSNQSTTINGKTTVKTVDLSTMSAMDFKSLINTVLPQFGVDWDYYEGALHFERQFKKTYHISLTPNETTTKMALGKNSSSQQGANFGNTSMTGNFNSTLESTFDGKVDTAKEIVDALIQFAGKDNVVISRGLGLATITCSRDCHRQVKSLIDSANALLTQNVAFHVEEITVTTKSVGQSGIDWNLVYQNLTESGKTIGLSLSTPSKLVQSGSGVISSNIVTSSNPTKFESSRLIVNALSSVSSSVNTKPYNLIAANNEPATLTAVDQQAYVAASTVVPTGTLGTPVYSQNVGYVTYGQLIQIIPTILPGGRVLVRFGLDDTKLKSITPAEKQGDVDKLLLGGAKFTTKTTLRFGSTLMLTGFKNQASNVEAKGLLPGQRLGSEAAQNETSETVILITPYLTGA